MTVCATFAFYLPTINNRLLIKLPAGIKYKGTDLALEDSE